MDKCDIDYKSKIFCKIWHIHLYMSIFFCNFASKILRKSQEEECTNE